MKSGELESSLYHIPWEIPRRTEGLDRNHKTITQTEERVRELPCNLGPGKEFSSKCYKPKPQGKKEDGLTRTHQNEEFQFTERENRNRQSTAWEKRSVYHMRGPPIAQQEDCRSPSGRLAEVCTASSANGKTKWPTST